MLFVFQGRSIAAMEEWGEYSSRRAAGAQMGTK